MPNLDEQHPTMGIDDFDVVKSVLLQESYKIKLYPEIEWGGHPIIVENTYTDNNEDDCICFDLYKQGEPWIPFSFELEELEADL